MKRFRNIVTNLLKTLSGEQVIDGRGGVSLSEKLLQSVEKDCVQDAVKSLLEKKENSITSNPLLTPEEVLKDGILIAKDYYVVQDGSSYSVVYATQKRQEEKMKEGKKCEENIKPNSWHCCCDMQGLGGVDELQEHMRIVHGNKGVKFDGEKVRMILLAPKGLEEEARVMTFGAEKYGDYNWRKGIHISRYLSAALRHIFSVAKGEFLDPESGLSHLAHAKANLGMAIQTLEDYPELNDLYKKEEK
jgi:hypothetical protein